MPVYKHKDRESWYASFYYINWKGERRRKKKEGFTSRKEALDYEFDFKLKMSGKCDMNFSSFAEIYLEDCIKRVRSATYFTKKIVVEKYLLPHFSKLPVNEITPAVIRNWQTELLEKYTENSAQYMRYINTQLACILNFADKYYNLKENPIERCETIGASNSKKPNFWTLAEFTRFIHAVNGDEPTHTAFQLLFWTGIRRGELMGLQPSDFNFKEKTMSIQRSRILVDNKRCFGKPKTKSSSRTIILPSFLASDVKKYIRKNRIKKNRLLFEMHPVYFWRHMEMYRRKAGLKAIRIHDFRHSHASLLIERGISPLAIAERLGHKDASVTLKVYSHLYPNKQNELAKMLDSLYEDSF